MAQPRIFPSASPTTRNADWSAKIFGRDFAHPERKGALILWAAMLALATLGFAMLLAILALLTWWSFIGDFQWVMLAFLGLLAAFASFSLRRKWRSP